MPLGTSQTWSSEAPHRPKLSGFLGAVGSRDGAEASESLLGCHPPGCWRWGSALISSLLSPSPLFCSQSLLRPGGLPCSTLRWVPCAPIPYARVYLRGPRRLVSKFPSDSAHLSCPRGHTATSTTVPTGQARSPRATLPTGRRVAQHRHIHALDPVASAATWPDQTQTRLAGTGKGPRRPWSAGLSKWGSAGASQAGGYWEGRDRGRGSLPGAVGHPELFPSRVAARSGEVSGASIRAPLGACPPKWGSESLETGEMGQTSQNRTPGGAAEGVG